MSSVHDIPYSPPPCHVCPSCGRETTDKKAEWYAFVRCEPESGIVGLSIGCIADSRPLMFWTGPLHDARLRAETDAMRARMKADREVKSYTLCHNCGHPYGLHALENEWCPKDFDAAGHNHGWLQSLFLARETP